MSDYTYYYRKDTGAKYTPLQTSALTVERTTHDYKHTTATNQYKLSINIFSCWKRAKTNRTP